jgi:hypothetical protein
MKASGFGVAYPGSKKTLPSSTSVRYSKVKATKKTQVLKIKFVRRQQGTYQHSSFLLRMTDTHVNLSAVVEVLDKPVMNSRMQFKFANVNAVVYG